MEWGVLSHVGEHILHDFYHSVSDQIQNLQKPRRGGGLREINACRKFPVPVNYFR
jgi:hypothetical protein